jgi:hypothetical protein
MNYRFHPEAESELHEACDYYEAKREGLGERFGEAFCETLARVLQRPLAWGLLEAPYRLCRLKRFPYGIRWGYRFSARSAFEKSPESSSRSRHPQAPP